MSDKFPLKAVAFSKHYDYMHFMSMTFRGKKVASGFRGVLSIDISVARSLEAVTLKDYTLAKSVLQRIAEGLNSWMIEPFAREFSCYHNGAGVQYDVEPMYALLKPNEHGTVNLTMDDVRALDKVL